MEHAAVLGAGSTAVGAHVIVDVAVCELPTLPL
jgi:hypothetical protein